ncbi:MAG: glycosyltransferase family 39 protein [Patescibacteria group bacterium]
MKKKTVLFWLFFVLALGALLRFYRMNDLAVFLADQASDSQKVLDMIRGKFTLLGPITSVGGFYNGPIVYYLMYPFYLLFKGDPIAGTVFQSVFSLLTIPLIFLLGKKIKNEKVGLIASFLFVISPLMIDYSRAAFNAYPAIFFSTLIIYLLILLIGKYKNWLALFLGIMIGWIIQMHYFAIVFLFLAFLYPIFLKKNRPPFSYYFFLSCGFFIGIAPFLLFEVRHQFLNVNLFLKYIFSNKSGGDRSISNLLYVWPQVTGWILFGNQFIAGLLGFVLVIVSTVLSAVKKQVKYISILVFLLFLVFLTGLVYGRAMPNHYIISFHTSLIILFALMIHEIFKGKNIYIILFCLILLVINFPSLNLTKKMHPIQRGLNISDFKKASSIIDHDRKGVYNVAMHAQGDNRAMPLRYMLSLANESPLDYEHYGEAEILYFIIPKTETLKRQVMWEYTSFGGSKVVSKWSLNNDFNIYKVAKN